MRFPAWLTLPDTPWRLRLLCLAGVGALVGMMLYVARISHALSYLSDDPEACINCHIMVPMYATWQHSSHGRVAVCNDCHVPHHSAAAKYYFKAKDGLRHSLLFTLRLERQVIEAIPESKHVIQQNCVRCHGNVMAAVGQTGHGSGGFDRPCVECHREVPHGRVHSLSATPNASVPPLTPVAPDWLMRAARGERR